MTGPVLLAIETSTPRGGVALASLDTQAVHPARTYDGTRGHAEDLLFAVDQALAACGASIADIGAVAVSVGPGSFTGVRVAVATAKGLALARGVPVVAVTSLEAVALAADAREGGGTRAAVLDARRGEVYCAAFDVGGAARDVPALRAVADVEAWLTALPGPLLVRGDALSLVTLPPGTTCVDGGPEATTVATLGLARLRAGKVTVASSLEPAYLRPPDLSLPASRGGPIG